MEGCPTLGGMEIGFMWRLDLKKQSQRDCVLQPKVAVLGYLGTPDADVYQPGVEALAPEEPKRSGVRANGRAATPSGLAETTESGSARRRHPRVAEYGNPGLTDPTPSV